MTLKVFRERNGYKLVSDARDIEVLAEYRIKVKEWCNENGIEATLATGQVDRAWAASAWGVNLWRVKDDKQRTMFVLRWA